MIPARTEASQINAHTIKVYTVNKVTKKLATSINNYVMKTHRRVDIKFKASSKEEALEKIQELNEIIGKLNKLGVVLVSDSGYNTLYHEDDWKELYLRKAGDYYVLHIQKDWVLEYIAACKWTKELVYRYRHGTLRKYEEGELYSTTNDDCYSTDPGLLMDGEYNIMYKLFQEYKAQNSSNSFYEYIKNNNKLNIRPWVRDIPQPDNYAREYFYYYFEYLLNGMIKGKSTDQEDIITYSTDFYDNETFKKLCDFYEITLDEDNDFCDFSNAMKYTIILLSQYFCGEFVYDTEEEWYVNEDAFVMYYGDEDYHPEAGGTVGHILYGYNPVGVCGGFSITSSTIMSYYGVKQEDIYQRSTENHVQSNFILSNTKGERRFFYTKGFNAPGSVRICDDNEYKITDLKEPDIYRNVRTIEFVDNDLYDDRFGNMWSGYNIDDILDFVLQ